MSDIRYSRHHTLEGIGETGQQRVCDARVLLVGAGGLGTAAGLYLARSGVGGLVVCDPDTIDVTNLPRQILFCDADVGSPKAEIAAQRLRKESPGLVAVPVTRRLDEAELTQQMAGCDVVLDCTDNLPSRWAINECCNKAGKPLVSGAAIRYQGQVAVFRHDEPGSPCYACLYSSDDEELTDCAGQGILASVAGTVGAVMATEALRVVAGFGSGLAGRLWVYDGGSGESRTIRIDKRADCTVCGKSTMEV